MQSETLFQAQMAPCFKPAQCTHFWALHLWGESTPNLRTTGLVQDARGALLPYSAGQSASLHQFSCKGNISHLTIFQVIVLRCLTKLYMHTSNCLILHIYICVYYICIIYVLYVYYMCIIYIYIYMYSTVCTRLWSSALYPLHSTLLHLLGLAVTCNARLSQAAHHMAVLWMMIFTHVLASWAFGVHDKFLSRTVNLE